MLDLDSIRNDFPILKREINGYPLVYFDNAATSQKPSQVIQALVDYYESHNANVHRGVHTLSEEASEMFEKAHITIGKFFNVKMQQVSMLRNSTEVINTIAYLLEPFYSGKKKIIVSSMEHHSNHVPWQQTAKRHGLDLEFIKMGEDFQMDYEDFENKISNDTAVVAIPHVSNVLGTINDVKRIAKIAKDHNAISVVDASQSAPHMSLNFKDLGIDFMAVTGHKMLAPMGIASMIGREELLEKVNPVLFGGEMISNVTYESAEWNSLPWKFEAGTANVGGTIAFAVAVNYLKKLGMKRIEKHTFELGDYAHEKLQEIDGIKIYRAKDSQAAGIVSFLVDKLHAHDLATILDQKGIALRSGHHCAQPLMDFFGMDGTARASFYVYNTKEEVDLLIEETKNTIKHFR